MKASGSGDVAQRYGTEHHEFELNRDSEVASAIEDFAWYSDEPGADAGALPVWFLSKMSRQHVTVALSGEGGDELFGGYLTYRADHWRGRCAECRGCSGARRSRTAHSLLPVSDAKIGFEYKLKRWLEGSLLHPDEAHLFWNGSFSLGAEAGVAAGLERPSPAASVSRICRAAEAVGFLNRYLLLDQQYYLQDNLLYKVDRMSMAHSLEVRPPLLDHRIVEFAARLPERLKIRGANQKADSEDGP